MKKALSFILAVVLVASVLPFSLTASAMPGGGLWVTHGSGTSGTTGQCAWTFDGTVLTISGNGDMGDYRFEEYANFNFVLELPWNPTEVIIKDGVTSIGNCAFYECTNLKSITIPNSVTSIGSLEFVGCSNLENVYITDTKELRFSKRTL